MAKAGKRHLRRSIKITLAVIALALAGTAGWAVFNNRGKGGNEQETADQPTPDTTPEAAPAVQEYHASMFFTGDALLHGTVYRAGRQNDGTYNYMGMMDLLGAVAEPYDLQYYNQETILGGTQLGLHGYPTFNSPQEYGDTMANYGFNLVSTANNHSLDQGWRGIESSLNYWKTKEGVVTAGTYLSQEDHDALPVYEINGITYTFLSWTYGTNGILPPSNMQYIVNDYTRDRQAMLDQVRKANDMCDVVIMAVHWGTEYVMEPNEDQKQLARELVDAGADIIIGNHPHVIQPAEHIGDAICFYAMGNMISAQANLYNWVGMMGGLDIHKTVADGKTTVKIENVRADLIYTWMNPTHTAFRTYPFNQLTDDILPDHEAVYEKYKAYITKMDDTIQVGGV